MLHFVYACQKHEARLRLKLAYVLWSCSSVKNSCWKCVRLCTIALLKRSTFAWRTVRIFGTIRLSLRNHTKNWSSILYTSTLYRTALHSALFCFNSALLFCFRETTSLWPSASSTSSTSWLTLYHVTNWSQQSDLWVFTCSHNKN